jgi:hypothetical protein
MKTLIFGRYALAWCLLATMPAACANPSALQPTAPTTRDAALTSLHFAPLVTRNDHSKSWMRPDKKNGALLYVGDYSTGDVLVFDFPSGKQVGTLTGLDGPYGMCVDAKGDIYVANFYGGTLVEFAHGAGVPKNIYETGGEPIGCSVSAKGDVSATSFSPGEVIVYAGGNPKRGTTYADPSCPYTWTFGYDDKGNLIGQYDDTVCALMHGTSSMTTLSESGITIDFPGGTAWDGKYIALGDQEAGGTFLTGVWPSTLSGTTITAAKSEVEFTGNCYSDYTDLVNPFFLGKDFAPVIPSTKQRAKYVLGANLWCADTGMPEVAIWYYPSGKFYESIGTGFIEPYGAAISAGK